MFIPFFVLGFMLVLLFSGVMVGSAIGISFAIALAPLLATGVFEIIGSAIFDKTTGFIMVAVPLFILMSELIVNSGLSDKLYNSITKLVYGVVPGGLLQVNLATSTVFAALCGSSTASAAALGRLGYSEVAIKRGYNKAITIGTLTAGGTIGILIPPSIPMIVYGSFADISVSGLFTAGIVPGLILAFLFSILVFIRVKLDTSLVGGFTSKLTPRDRLMGAINLIPFMLLIFVVLGVIYGGVATPTEAAGFGSAGTIILMLAYRVFSMKAVWTSLENSARLTSMIFFIVLSAQLIGKVLAYYHIPPMIENWSAGLSFLPLVLLICLIYLVLGCLFDGLSLLLITLPFIIPVALGQGLNLYWLGILVTILVEIGMLTPPVGMNLYVMQGVTKEPMGLIVRGSAPFIICQVIIAVLVIAFPHLPFAVFGVPTR